MPDSTRGAAQLAALEQRVTGLEHGIKDLGGFIQTLSSKIESSNKTDWGTLLTAGILIVTVIGSLGSALYIPIWSQQSRFEIDVSNLKLTTVPRGEHEEHWRRDVKDYERMEERVKRLEDRSGKR